MTTKTKKDTDKKDTMKKRLVIDIAEAREDVEKGRLYTADKIRKDLEKKSI